MPFCGGKGQYMYIHAYKLIIIIIIIIIKLISLRFVRRGGSHIF
jgi:hypothetical protein